ncbi:MAG: DinB family protein [Anaerolineae bacterium]|nr:DinB family protein [Anaerolineae bacterium]
MTALTPENFTLALRKTPVVLNSLMRDVTQQQAQQMTDGADGWSVIETLCHIRDFGDVLAQRVDLVLTQEKPALPSMQPGKEHRNRDFQQQDLRAEFAIFLDVRRRLVERLLTLTPEQWQRIGLHAAYGEMTVLELVIHATWHDLNHIEQIARSLQLSETLV